MAKAKIKFKVGDIIGYWEYLGEVHVLQKDGIHTKRKLVCKCLKCGTVYTLEVNNLTRSKYKMCKPCVNRMVWTKHNCSNNPLYFVFKTMHARCENNHNMEYNNYGGRGITVCDEWADTEEDIKTFVKWSEEHGYKRGLQLDRHDNDKGYSPDNCRWVTPSVNTFNRRNIKGYKYKNGTWWSYITVNKELITLGYFKTEEEALKARMEAELKYYGEYSPSHRRC